MGRVSCLLRGKHAHVLVVEAGPVARPGGILPSLDGFMSYVETSDYTAATHRACTRCRKVQSL